VTSKQRSRARVVQALYQWLVSGGDIPQIEQQFLTQKEGKISKAFFSNLFINIPKNISVLDEIINPHSKEILVSLAQLKKPFCIWESMS